MGSCFNKDKNSFDEFEFGVSYADNRPKKLLLMGSANSGKTTLMKQFDILFEEGNAYEMGSVNDIRQSCIDNIIILSTIINDKQNIELLQSLSINNNDDLLSISKLISNIWSIQKVKTIYKYRFNYGEDGFIFDDDMELFFDNIDKIMDTQTVYKPETKHMYPEPKEMKATIQQNDFHIIDIPYAYKKKAIFHFENVDAMLFVA